MKQKRKKFKRKLSKLEKITKREDKRLGGHGCANTQAFWQRQTFGPASEVRTIYTSRRPVGEPDLAVLMGERMK